MNVPATPLQISGRERCLVGAVSAAVPIGYAMAGGAYDSVLIGQLGILIWWAIALGLATAAFPRSPMPSSLWVVAAALAGMAGLAVLALSYTASDEKTIRELSRVLHHLGVLMLVACAVRRGSTTAAVAGLTAGAGLVCALALGSRLVPQFFPEDLVRETFRITRLSYPLNYWNAVGAWGAMTAALALGITTDIRQVVPRALVGAIVPAALTTVYLSYSRAGVIGAATAFVAVLVLSQNRSRVLLNACAAGAGTALVVLAIRASPAVATGAGDSGAGGVFLAILMAMGIASLGASRGGQSNRGRRRRWSPRVRRWGIGVTAAVLLVAAVVVAPPIVSSAWTSFTTPYTTDQSDPSARLSTLNGNRYQLYASALQAGSEHPWRGIGPGTYEFWWNQDARDPEFVRDAHSLYLETWAEFGLPGLLLVLALLAALAGGGVLALRAARRGGSASETGAVVAGLAAFVTYCVQAGVDWLWEVTACTVLGLAAAAIVCCAVPRPARTPRRSPRPLWRGVAVAFCLIAILVQVPPLVSVSQVRASQAAVRASDPEAAAAAAQNAVEAEPWAATPYVQRALVAEQAGDLRSAEQDVQLAIEREPTNWRHPLVLARVRAERGDTRGSLRAFRQARSLRPLATLFSRAG